MLETPTHESLTEWHPRDVVGFGGRVLVLTVVLYGLVRLPEVGMAGALGASAPYWFAKLLLDVVVLSYVVVRARWVGAKLVGALWLVYAGLQFVSLVEIHLYGMISASELAAGAGRNLLVGAALIGLVVAAFGRLSGEDAPVGDDRLRLSTAQWAWKLAVLAVIFLVLMILAGLVVFERLALAIDPVAYADYELLTPPSWIIPFQLVRGLVFTALLVPVIAMYRGGYRATQLAVATLFAVLLSSNMIAGYDAVPGLLWIAHFIELFSQAFVYGLVAVALLFRPHHPLRSWLGRSTEAGGTTE